MPLETFDLIIKEDSAADGIVFTALTDGEKVYQVLTDNGKYTFAKELPEGLTEAKGVLVYVTKHNRSTLTTKNINKIRISATSGVIKTGELYFVVKEDNSVEKSEVVEKPKRKRRTKSEIESDKKANK